MPVLAFLFLTAIGVWLYGGDQHVSNDGDVGGSVRRSGRGKSRTRHPEPNGSGKRLKGKKDGMAPGSKGNGDHVRGRSRRNLGRKRDGPAPEDSGVVEPAPAAPDAPVSEPPAEEKA